MNDIVLEHLAGVETDPAAEAKPNITAAPEGIEYVQDTEYSDTPEGN